MSLVSVVSWSVAKHTKSKKWNANYWNPTRFRQHKQVLREIEGMQVKSSVQKRRFGILKAYAFEESNRPPF